MDGGAELTGKYSQRVLENPPPGTLTPHLTNVRKFRKFPPFHRPVTEDQAFLVRSYTKIVTKVW